MSLAPITNSSPLSPVGMLSPTTTKPKAAPGTTGTSDGGLTSTTTGSTFLNLLVKELQNQDPSAPMDSTAMVGQMISLNQLDQLIGINQTLTGATSATSGRTKASAQTTGSADLIAQRADLINGSSSQASSQLSSATTPAQAALAAANDPRSTLNFSALNIPFGAK